MKQLKRTASSLDDDVNPLVKNNEKVEPTFGEDEMVVRRRVKKVAKRFPTRFIGLMTCINIVFPNWCTLKVPKLKCFGEQLCRNWIRSSEQSLTDGIEANDWQWVGALHPFLPAYPTKYEPSCTSETALLVRIKETRLRRTKWVSSFVTGASNEDIGSSISSTAFLKLGLNDGYRVCPVRGKDYLEMF